MPAFKYPQTKRVDVVEKHFGQTVPDPYRWLEGDIRSHADVDARAEAETEVASADLATLHGRDAFGTRLTALFDDERVSQPLERGRRYFFTRNSGLESQDSLVMCDGLDGVETVLINPTPDSLRP